MKPRDCTRLTPESCGNPCNLVVVSPQLNTYVIFGGVPLRLAPSDIAFAAPFTEDPDLFLIRSNKFSLFSFSRRKLHVKGCMVLVSSICHLPNQFLVPEVECHQPPLPAQGLRVVRVRFLVAGYYRPHRMKFPVLAEQMVAA